MSKAIDDVLAERARQVNEEGWTPEHDDQHDGGELAYAAAAYAFNAGDCCDSANNTHIEDPPEFWPFDSSWWKPKGARRDLVRAAALVLAEIERRDRVGVEG